MKIKSVPPKKPADRQTATVDSILDMVAMPGDWIITGIAGERYPCREDIFYKTYEPAPKS